MIALAQPPIAEPWSYATAFARNRGLLNEVEQARLQGATVAIAGLGGVGGSHAMVLARQGVGGFRLADPDHYAVANFNRQVGAKMSSLDQNKARETADMIWDVNPQARIEIFEVPIRTDNVDRFLDGADLVLDGLDFFAIDARRELFARARERGLWVLTAGPIGFSAAFVAFSPDGMSFDDYCGFQPGMSPEELLIAWAVALTPRATHRPYMDLAGVNTRTGGGPSAALACQLASSLIGMEALAILLGRRPPRAAPAYVQLDLFRGIYHRGVLRFGGRGPLQRLKRYLFARHLRRLGVLT